ncbi:MAG: single-stranded DNA-binding protein [Cellulomonadaceae bacterium]
MNASTTIAGWVGKTPVLVRSGDTAHTTVRVACTTRYRNDRGEWADGQTQWYAVKAWNDVAANVCASIHKGDPVVVTGRIGLEEWDNDEGRQKMMVIRAVAIGHDLTRGTTTFTRVVHAGGGAAASEIRPEPLTGDEPQEPEAPDFVRSSGSPDPFTADPPVPPGPEDDAAGDTAELVDDEELEPA